MTRPNGHLFKISALSEVNHSISRKACILKKRSVVKARRRKPVPVKWLFKSKEEADGLICLKSINLVKGYMQVPVVDFTESFSPVVLDTSTSIMILLTL